jgi:hypothetical protein
LIAATNSPQTLSVGQSSQQCLAPRRPH